MQTSLKTGFAQILSCCPKNLSCPQFGGGLQPRSLPGPYAYGNNFKGILERAAIYKEIGSIKCSL